VSPESYIFNRIVDAHDLILADLSVRIDSSISQIAHVKSQIVAWVSVQLVHDPTGDGLTHRNFRAHV
jgi:hypothetical protein